MIKTFIQTHKTHIMYGVLAALMCIAAVTYFKHESAKQYAGFDCPVCYSDNVVVVDETTCICLDCAEVMYVEP